MVISGRDKLTQITTQSLSQCSRLPEVFWLRKIRGNAYECPKAEMTKADILAAGEACKPIFQPTIFYYTIFYILEKRIRDSCGCSAEGIF